MLKSARFDTVFCLVVVFLLFISVFTLRVVAPTLFPGYFLFLVLAVVLFVAFSFFDFEIISLFSRHFYLGSLALLILTLLIGRVTRGAIRWIPIGILTLQASELVRPFLLVFFANEVFSRRLTGQRLIRILLLMLLPVILILIQPSLGVSFLLAAGFLGIFLASEMEKKNFLYLGVLVTVLLPLIYLLLAPYQKARIATFLNPEADPLGKGYNSIQAVITVGSGGLLGRGLGRGVQTQLAFLPEKENDFIFASIAEELGFVGAFSTIILFFLLFWRLTVFVNQAASPAARAYLTGLLVTLLTQFVVHTGMNLGILPITGIPLPLVSAGGSSLIATMIGLGIALGARRR